LTGLEKIGTTSYALNAFYELGRDIDASATLTDNYNGGQGWQPIIGEFSGTFDGKNHKIKNLYINRPGTDNIGLFSYLTGLVKNLGLQDLNICGKDYVGSVAGYLKNNGTLDNIDVTGSVSGNNQVGGVVGMTTGNINGCSSSANVNATGIKSGGLVGYSDKASISNSSATGVVLGSTNVGGLVGDQNGSYISNSYATGFVSGITNIGGLAGRLSNGIIQNSCYAAGTVAGENMVGGLVGQLYVTISGSISDSYALNPEITRTVSEEADFGRIIGGKNNGNLSKNYARKDIIEPFTNAFCDKNPSGKDGGDLLSYSINDEGILTVQLP
jgi:hypothetical protein